MSIHIPTSEEARARIKQQKTNSTIASLLISLLVIAALAGVLALLKIFIPAQPTQVDFVTGIAQTLEEPRSNEQSRHAKPQREMPPLPTQASPFAPSLLSTLAPTSFVAPSSNELSALGSPGLGHVTDFGLGNEFGSNDGSNNIFTEFNTSGRVAYVIDYSLSMKQKGRDELMRTELANAVADLEGGPDYALIFFAGPVWQSTDTLQFTTESRKVHTIFDANGNASNANFKATWLSPTQKTISESLEDIRSMPLALGTEWGAPLTKALEMNPKPDSIIFMTDGIVKNASQVVQRIGQQAKEAGVIINTISLLEPKAAGDMKTLAELTGGTAIMVKSATEIVDLTTGESTAR